MLEEFGWFVCFIVLFYLTHLQFKVCIPVTLIVMKICYSLGLLFLVKLYVYFYIYGNDINLEAVKNATVDILKQAKSHFEL